MKKCDTAVYNKIKPDYKDTILWFCIGEVYLSFAEDAIKTAGILNLHLYDGEDQNMQIVKLCVFPVNALVPYLQAMVNAHCQIGIC